MNRNEFLHVTGVEPETFDQLSDGGKIQFLNAVGYAVNQAKDPEDAERLASEAIRSCYEDWQSAMQTVARFIVPPGESDSVASLEHKLSMLKKKVGLVEQPQEAR